MDWNFVDPPNVAVFTTRKIMLGVDSITSVFHEADDGSWQFVSGEPWSTECAAILALSEIVDIDPSVVELADLPLGWRAWRTAKSDVWQRAKSD